LTARETKEEGVAHPGGRKKSERGGEFLGQNVYTHALPFRLKESRSNDKENSGGTGALWEKGERLRVAHIWNLYPEEGVKGGKKAREMQTGISSQSKDAETHFREGEPKKVRGRKKGSDVFSQISTERKVDGGEKNEQKQQPGNSEESKCQGNLIKPLNPHGRVNNLPRCFGKAANETIDVPRN